MRRRRTGKVAFDTKVIQDVGIAAIAVRILPNIVNSFFQIDPTFYTVVGSGGGYLAGTMLKNKTVANASIALGLVEFVAPVIENLIGGVGGGLMPQVTTSGANPKMMPPQKMMPKVLEDYTTLNDYVSSPRSRSYQEYYDSY